MADMETRRERITNLVTVTLVTVLIWIWAAGETREEITSFTDLRFSGQTRDSVRISPEELPSVSFLIRGPRREVDAIAARFRDAVEIPIGTLGVPSTPGEHEIDLVTLGQSFIDANEIPVTVLAADPQTVRISIESLQRRRIPVVVELPDGVQTTDAVDVAPGEVELLLPASLADLPGLSVTARIADADVADLPSGRRHELEVSLVLPDRLTGQSDAIRMTPRKARVGLDLVSTDASIVVPSIPVQVSGPPADLDRHVVTIDPASVFLRDVTLRGPKAAIDDIAGGRANVIAFIHLTSDDLANRLEETRISMWRLPAGVEVSSIGEKPDTSPTISITIEDRPRQP
ncbi:MAG: hypothetical protein GY825_05050 [Phycisphaeraceae bacterium]|nr:hypothetical protein [Phycisphaeraceae bacterium]